MTTEPINEEAEDDQIIAVVFKRSLFIIAAVLVVATAIWLITQGLNKEETIIVEANLIQPQSTDIDKQITPPKVNFTDITKAAGITHTHFNGAYGERLLPEAMGAGVAVLDYNNDQNVDLLFINGQSWPWHKGKTSDDKTSSLILYQGDGTGKFNDVTEKSSLDTSIYGMGAAVGDFDGDGYVDIFISAVGANRLYRNIGGQRFEEVSIAAGVSGADDAWSTGAGFIDFDNDGDLDLMVLNYVHWSRAIDLQADYQLTGLGRAYGPPSQFAGSNSYLYRNDGKGVFSDVSVEFGIQINNSSTGLPVGKGLSLMPTDVDNDGWVDLIVANDTVRNFLFRNKNGNGFEEIGIESGIAFDNTGAATGAMGIDNAIFGQSMEHAVAIGNFGNEMTSLYVRAEDSSLFTDQAIVTGVGPASRRAVTFGLFFFDYDLDGRIDLLQTNGHIEPEINVVEPSQHYAQAPQLFWNCGAECSRQFIPVSLAADNNLSQAIVGRAAAYADIDKDGDLDVILTQVGESPKLLRNDQKTGHNWIQFEILDDVGASAYGAEIEIITTEHRQFGRVEPTRSYLSQVETTLTFGIGKANEIESVKIKWIDGKTLSIDNPAINQRHRITLD